MKAVGVLGGTFDPVHFGHLRAAVEVRDRLGLDEMRLLPAGTPPHRPAPAAAPEHRRAMLDLAIAEARGLLVDDRELNRPGKSYMVDTLADIRSELLDVPLLLVIGQDAANALDQWHQWRRLFDLAHLVIMRRPDSKASYPAELQAEMSRRQVEPASMPGGRIAGRVASLEITQLDISSTAIRDMLALGHSPDYLLPDAVIAYIRRNGLYGVAR
jgi:nicotinate-nucleotide adenylyltransferase